MEEADDSSNMVFGIGLVSAILETSTIKAKMEKVNLFAIFSIPEVFWSKKIDHSSAYI